MKAMTLSRRICMNCASAGDELYPDNGILTRVWCEEKAEFRHTTTPACREFGERGGGKKKEARSV